MPKFSAYMRGEKGIQGETGQASLLDGIVDGYSNLPDRAILTEDKNYVYYVKEEDGIHLYVYEGGSGEDWQHLGVATAGFSTIQYVSASTKEWFPGVQPDVTIIPHDNQQTTGLKSFDFHFNIPESQPAGFSTVSASVSNIEFGNQPQVSITTSGNNWEKNFHFNFEIPKGEPAGFSTGMTFAIEALPSTSNATVSVIPNPNSPNNAKEFDFNFGIPTGRPGGFGEISVTTTQVDSTVPAEVSITTSGEDYSKNFYFNFRIPQGPKGNPGDALGTYLGINFTTTDIDSNNNIYWNNNILHIKRDNNAKIPICILNSENNNIASTFELTENEILYYADSPFNGILYLIAKSNIPTFKIGKCTTIPYEQNPYVEAYYENENNPYEITLDFYLTRGTNQSFDEKANWNNIEGNITDNEDLMNLLASKVNNEDLIDLLASKVNNEDLENLNFIQEAPNDGKIYGRKEGSWEEIISQSTEEGSGSPGRGITSIQKTGELGLTDIYTILYSDETTSNFTIDNGEQGEQGNGILEIRKVGESGLEDTYGIFYTNGTSTTFIVTNGSNGIDGSTENIPFTLIPIDDFGNITINESKYEAFALDSNLSIKTSKWETFDHSQISYEPFIYFHDSVGEKIGEISVYHTPEDKIGIQLQASQFINENNQVRNTLGLEVSSSGECLYKISNTTNFRKALGATTNEGYWPIELGGTGTNTSEQAWINLGGGASGKHPEDYYSFSTHNHDNLYSLSTHNHDDLYSFSTHIHDQYLTTSIYNNLIFYNNNSIYLRSNIPFTSVAQLTTTYEGSGIYFRDSENTGFIGIRSIILSNATRALRFRVTSEKGSGYTKEFAIGAKSDGTAYANITKDLGAAIREQLNISVTTIDPGVNSALTSGTLLFVYG